MDAKAARVIAKESVGAWVDRLMKGAEVIAPVARHGGDVAFAPVSSPGEVLWDFTNSLEPPKASMLPQTDPIVKIEKGQNGFHVEAVHDDRARVLLNVRSCDAKALVFLHKMHESDLPDESYLSRARAAAVITLACNRPCPLGFCVCCDAGPFLASGYDLQLTDLGSCLLAEPGSEKGRALLGDAGALFRPASDEEARHRTELEEAALRGFGEETCHFGSAMRRVSTGRVADELWSAMGDWCLECGGCNFACPTCYCFSVKDHRENGGWMRCRTWDSCQYAAFTMEASGHNPRAEQALRMRRRFFHKASAQYYLRDGAVGCVGCGRCVQVCMGTTDMPAVVAAIRKGTWNG